MQKPLIAVWYGKGGKYMAVKVMIVDDSPFARTLLAGNLAEGGYEVVGEADSLNAALEVYE